MKKIYADPLVLNNDEKENSKIKKFFDCRYESILFCNSSGFIS